MAVPTPQQHQVIDLDSDVDGPGLDVEWDLASPLFLDQVSTTRPDFLPEVPHLSAADAAEAYQVCLQVIKVVFPDISHDHVQELWDKNDKRNSVDTERLHQTLIEQILDGGIYPKERDRLKQLKKRDRDSPGAEAVKWKDASLHSDPGKYSKVARARLYERFDWVPSKFINDTLKEQSSYYGAFFAIQEADRNRRDSLGSSFSKLKTKRSTQVNSYDIMASFESEGYSLAELREEMQAAETRWENAEEARHIEMERNTAKIQSDEEYRRKGEIMECACCFSDDNPPTDMTHCDGDVPHFFCFGCAKRNAETDMTSLKYALRCMDQSRCEATFDRYERARFLDAIAIEKLERLQQQDDIRRAEMCDLESCPFCEFAAICQPTDLDRVFDCQNPDCMESSCRLCREKTHIPLSCEEARKETGIGERHAIEEARTDALIRSCPKCKVRIIKEDGCNKVICTNCGSMICDYCGADISKVRYEHFDQLGRRASEKGAKCPLYDEHTRKDEQVEQAGKAAMDKVRKENPTLSEDDLKIKFSEVVKHQSNRVGNMLVERIFPPPRAVVPIGMGHAAHHREAMVIQVLRQNLRGQIPTPAIVEEANRDARRAVDEIMTMPADDRMRRLREITGPVNQGPDPAQVHPGPGPQLGVQRLAQPTIPMHGPFNVVPFYLGIGHQPRPLPVNGNEQNGALAFDGTLHNEHGRMGEKRTLGGSDEEPIGTRKKARTAKHTEGVAPLTVGLGQEQLRTTSGTRKADDRQARDFHGSEQNGTVQTGSYSQDSSRMTTHGGNAEPYITIPPRPPPPNPTETDRPKHRLKGSIHPFGMPAFGNDPVMPILDQMLPQMLPEPRGLPDDLLAQRFPPESRRYEEPRRYAHPPPDEMEARLHKRAKRHRPRPRDAPDLAAKDGGVAGSSTRGPNDNVEAVDMVGPLFPGPIGAHPRLDEDRGAPSPPGPRVPPYGRNQFQPM